MKDYDKYTLEELLEEKDYWYEKLEETKEQMEKMPLDSFLGTMYFKSTIKRIKKKIENIYFYLDKNFPETDVIC